MKKAFCASCKAEIVWALTESGKPIPLDEKPEQRFVITALPDGSPGRARLKKTYQTHFVTCPNSKEHRKSR